MDHQVPFSYFKKPWAKWCFFIAGLLQIPLIFANTQEYRLLEESGMYSSTQLSEYLMQYKFSGMIHLVCALVLLGAFLIGSLARSKKSAKLAETILFLAVSLIYIAGIVLWGSVVPSLPLYVISLCLIWAGFIFSLRQYIKECRKHED